MKCADLTTLRVGGALPDLHEAHTRAELKEFVRAHPLVGEELGEPDVLFIAGGSNLLIADTGFAGPSCLIRTQGVQWAEPDDRGRVRVRAEAGEDWDTFVADSVARGLSGLEALSGIPGSVGATPVQNVGAYGAEVADCLVEVLVLDRATGEELTLSPDDLSFGYRTSLLKRSAADVGAVRYVVLAVTFELQAAQHTVESGHTAGQATAVVRYGQLAHALGVELGARVPIDEVRSAVVALRASKGMVLDAEDHDSWSAGSFFTNPILPLVNESGERVTAADVLPAGAPAYPVLDHATGQPSADVVKTSAAWLIEHAGFSRGFAVGAGRAALSSKHTLALTNRGEAAAADVVALARHIRAGVEESFGITLVPEPNLVGLTL